MKEDAARFGDILSLGDKCDSCVILQICGSCHDDAHDPGFEFELEERIDRQRHGTTEPGTGRPKATTAQQTRDARPIARTEAHSASDTGLAEGLLTGAAGRAGPSGAGHEALAAVGKAKAGWTDR